MPAQLADRVEDDQHQEGGLLDNDLGNRVSPVDRGGEEAEGGSRSSRVSPEQQAAFGGSHGPRAGHGDAGDGLKTSPVGGDGNTSGAGSSDGKPSRSMSHQPSSGGNAKSKAIGKATDAIGGNPEANRGSVENKVNQAAGEAAKAAIASTGVGAPVAQVGGQVVEKVGVKNIAKAGGFVTLLFLTPLIFILLIFAYVVTHPYQAAKKLLFDASGRRFAYNVAKKVGGSTFKAVIGALAYETDYKPGQVIAAPTGKRPEPGTLLELISKVDYKKSQYRYGSIDCPYDIKTKAVVAFDGKTRNVIDKVVDKKGKVADIAKPEVTSCVMQHYPILEAMVRSPEARTMNRQMNVQLNYAEPKDSDKIKGKTQAEVNAALHKKTLERVWKNNQESTDCQKDFKVTNTQSIDQAVNKVKNDLLCGEKPEDIKLSIKLPPEEDLNSTNPARKAKAQAAAATVLCTFNEKLVQDDEKYNNQLKSRYKSSSRAGFEALTLADTGVNGDIATPELNGDFYKISAFSTSRAYNYQVDGLSVGTQVDPEALASRVIGILRAEAKSVNVAGSDSKAYSLKEACDLKKNGGGSSITTPDQNIINVYYILQGKIRDSSNGVFTYKKPPDMNQVLTRTIKIVTNVSNAGTENGPDNFNRMTQGAKSTFHNYNLSLLGGQYQDGASAAQDVIAMESISRFNEQKNGIAYRLFSPNNIRSLASRFTSGVTARPDQVAQTAIASAIDLLNPIKSYARVNDAIAYYGAGENNRAMAAEDDDMAYWRLDPAGVAKVPGSNNFTNKDMLANATYIEGLQKSNVAAQAKFAIWDTCMKRYYASREILETSKDRDCKVVRGATLQKDDKPAELAEKALAARYAAYVGDKNIFAAWVKLSSEEQDASMYASNDKGVIDTGIGTGGDTGAGGPQSDPGADTSKTPCPNEPGIVTAPADPGNGVGADGVVQAYGPGRVPKNKIKLCVVQSIVVNVSVASNLNKMINAARADGLGLSGGGWRSYDTQKALRIKNGCPADDTASSSTCRVPTAPPGKSNHEQGEAIDFNGMGGQHNHSSPTFKWLSANAGNYGFINLKSESWHWSRTGG